MESEILQIFNVLGEDETTSNVDSILRKYVHAQDFIDADNFSCKESQENIENKLILILSLVFSEYQQRFAKFKTETSNFEAQIEQLEQEKSILNFDISELNHLVSHQKDQIEKLYKEVQHSESKIDELHEKISSLKEENFQLEQQNKRLENIKREPLSLIELKHSQSLIELEKFKNDNDNLEIENMALKETLYEARVELALLSSRKSAPSIDCNSNKEENMPSESLDNSVDEDEAVKNLSFKNEPIIEDSCLENKDLTQNFDEKHPECLKIEDKEPELIEDKVMAHAKLEEFENFFNDEEILDQKDNFDSPTRSSKSTRNNSDTVNSVKKDHLQLCSKSELSIIQTEFISMGTDSVTRRLNQKVIGTQTDQEVSKLNLPLNPIKKWNLKSLLYILIISMISMMIFYLKMSHQECNCSEIKCY